MTRRAPCLLLLAALALGACAGAPPAARRPLVGRPGVPLPVAILGAQYTLPTRLDVDDHRDDPGLFVLAFTDRITRCEGFLLFEEVGAAERHEEYVAGKIDALSADWAARQVRAVPKAELAPMLGQQARVSLFELSNDQAAAGAALLDRHFPEQRLSVVAYAFCDDLALVRPQLEALTALVDTQRR